MEKIALSPPDIGEREIAAVAEALRSGWITTGPKTKLFERKIAEYCGVNRAVCLSSATAALELCLRLLGVGEGDEVIVCAYTYTASASVIAHVGAKIVLVDCQKDSLQPDLEKLRSAITERTRVIIPVDIGGRLADYDSIIELARSVGDSFKPKNQLAERIGRIAVLGDGAHSFGSSQGGRMSGSLADFTAFSFHAVKNLTTAEGGALAWRKIQGVDDEEIYRSLCLMSLHGQSKDALAKTGLGSWEYDVLSTAYKCNMTDISAAIGLVQLERYEELLRRRHELCAVYDGILKPLGLCSMDHFKEGQYSNCHLYMCRIPNCDHERRCRIITRLAQEGVPSNVHFKPLPLLTAYRNLGFDIADYPNAYGMYENEISLPLYSKLSIEQAEYIAKSLVKAVETL